MRLVPTSSTTATESKPVAIPSFEVRVTDRTSEQRVLDFDVETVAAGFADPNWVPQKITCVSWSWMGEDEVHSRVCGPMGLYGEEWRRRLMLRMLLEQINQADMLIGHNIARFDLPVINAEALRFSLPPIHSVLIHDTMRMARAKGFKKGQDNLAHLYQLQNEKMPLDWQQWQDAYNEEGWPTIRERAESDVRGHKELYAAMIAADKTSPWGILRKPSRWHDGR